jgi:hypothetical protein
VAARLDDAGVDRLRGDLIRRVCMAVDPPGGVTPELQEATVQALCVVAGIVFASQQGVPSSARVSAEIGVAALGGMRDWLRRWDARN